MWIIKKSASDKEHLYTSTISNINPIQNELFGNFIQRGGAKIARAFCLFISRQLLALELSFKFV